MIYKRNREDYLDALGSADKINLIEIKKGYNILVEHMANEMIGSYWNIFL